MKGTFGLTFKERVYGTRQDKKDLERRPRKNTKTIGIQSCPVWVGDAILHLLILDEMLHMNKTSKLLLGRKAGGLVRWDSLDLLFSLSLKCRNTGGSPPPLSEHQSSAGSQSRRPFLPHSAFERCKEQERSTACRPEPADPREEVCLNGKDLLKNTLSP